MRKVFKCQETGEILSIIQEKYSDYSYENVRNMNKDDLINVLSFANENTLRDAIRCIAKERVERLIRLLSLIHGRMYEILRK